MDIGPKVERALQHLESITDGDFVEATYFLYDNYNAEEVMNKGILYNFTYGLDEDHKVWARGDLFLTSSGTNEKGLFFANLKKL